MRGAKRIDVLFGSTITTIYKGTTDIDNSDSTEANLRVLYPLDRFGIAKNPAVFASGNHTIAVVKADSFVNVNGNPYPIELFLSSDMKLVYAFDTGSKWSKFYILLPILHNAPWDMSKAEAHFTNTVVRTLATLSESPPLNAADDIHQKHGSMKQFSCQGVEKHNDDAKRNYFSSNQWDAPAEDRVQAGRAA
eukprot:Em0687g1a